MDVKRKFVSGDWLYFFNLTSVALPLSLQSHALTVSGVGAREYRSARLAVSKVLGVGSSISLSNLAVRFGCMEAEPLANQILTR